MTPLMCSHHAYVYAVRRRRFGRYWTKGQRLDWAALVIAQCPACHGDPQPDHTRLPREPEEP